MEFQDESRDIASEYKGGIQKYRRLTQDVAPNLQDDNDMSFMFPPTAPPAPSIQNQPLPPIQGAMSGVFPDPMQQPIMSNVFDSQPKQDPGTYAMQPPNSVSTNGSHYGGSDASATGHASVTPTPNISFDLPGQPEPVLPVSYTHLTLPTKRIV